jgi:hypothetical protein
MAYETVALGASGETIGSRPVSEGSIPLIGSRTMETVYGSGITLGPGVPVMPTTVPGIDPSTFPGAQPPPWMTQRNGGITLGPGVPVGPEEAAPIGPATPFGLPWWGLALGGLGVGIVAVWGYGKWQERKMQRNAQVMALAANKRRKNPKTVEATYQEYDPQTGRYVTVPPGMYWVKSHRRKDGTLVKGHLAKKPRK